MTTMTTLPSRPLRALALCLAVAGLGSTHAAAQSAHTTSVFQGVKVNGGTATHSTRGRSHVLTLSGDFVVPSTPAPHWQVVDSGGNAYLLQRLMVKGQNGEKLNQSIVVPPYVPDVAKVQIWCAFAQTLLGESAFAAPVTTYGPLSQGSAHATTPFAGVKANTGRATHQTVNGRSVLTLSSDFVVPDAPAPHWQVVDSSGNAYLLERLKIKGDVYNRTIVVPAYVPDIAKIQIWCAWAEALLGEASFDAPVH
jgi:hypothetical protein